MTDQDPRKLPDFSKMTLDFSQFHPLDHPLLGCHGYPGGWRRHLAYRWEFQWQSALRRQLLCRLGRHHPVSWYTKSGQLDRVACRNCGRDMP